MARDLRPQWARLPASWRTSRSERVGWQRGPVAVEGRARCSRSARRPRGASALSSRRRHGPPLRSADFIVVYVVFVVSGYWFVPTGACFSCQRAGVAVRDCLGGSCAGRP